RLGRGGVHHSARAGPARQAQPSASRDLVRPAVRGAALVRRELRRAAAELRQIPVRIRPDAALAQRAAGCGGADDGRVSARYEALADHAVGERVGARKMLRDLLLPDGFQLGARGSVDTVPNLTRHELQTVDDSIEARVVTHL